MKQQKGFLIFLFFFAFFLVPTYNNQYKSSSISSDNVCTFHIADRLFSLLYLQSNNPYVININDNEKILYNFCHSFIPNQCQASNKVSNTSQNSQVVSEDDEQLLDAFAYYIKKQVSTQTNQTTNQQKTTTKYTCQPYTSNSYLYNFNKNYIKHNDKPQLTLTLATNNKQKSTQFHIFCSSQQYFKLKDYKLQNDQKKLVIYGQSAYGCPVFQISSLWATLEDNSLILGIILFVLGFQLLFYGLLMINVTVFIAGYFISFAILGGIFTVFLGPNSSSIAVYFSLLFILLSSTLIAYGLTKLINVSIFFIGAFFGLILGALVNTLFSSIFSVHSVWSLVFFEVMLTIPFGLMTFKYSNEVIIMSTSLTGSYFVIRPISWILGGFPNQFLLYQMYESQELSSVPFSFYIYLLLIIVLALMGGFYQYLKLQRQDPSNTVMTNIVTSNIEQPLDKIKETVDKLIARYSSSNGDQQKYKKMKQLEYQTDFSGQNIAQKTQYGQIDGAQQRKQKEKKSRNSKDQQFF